MTTWQSNTSTFNPFAVTNCLHCGDPIQQPKHGGRPRRYCDKPACRKAGNRAEQKLAAEREEQSQRYHLQQIWKLYDPATTAILETILAEHGTTAASQATEAIQREMEALRKLAEAQRIVAQAEGGSEQQMRLAAIQELELRFRLDTEARHFKAWLRKQGHYPKSSLPQRLLDDERLPFYASRSFYEAKLHLYGYSAEEISQFQELWKALLLTQA